MLLDSCIAIQMSNQQYRTSSQDCFTTNYATTVEVICVHIITSLEGIVVVVETGKLSC